MLNNRKGDMGFGEAAISVIAVVLILNAFAAAVAGHDYSSDPGKLDFGMLDFGISDGEFVLNSAGYVESYIQRESLDGLELRVSCPLYRDYRCSFGSATEYSFIYSGTGVAHDDCGRTVPVVYRVSVC